MPSLQYKTPLNGALQKTQRINVKDESDDAETTSETLLKQLSEQLHALETLLTNRHESSSATSTDTTIVDGRYRGGNGTLLIDLRLDENISGVISGDIYALSNLSETWLSSFRTNPRHQVSLADGSWDIVIQDQGGKIKTGTLALQLHSSDPLSLLGTIQLDDPVAGLRSQIPVSFIATWVSSMLRSLEIEIAREEGVSDINAYSFNGNVFTVDSCFSNAGFEVTQVHQPVEILHPTSGSGWEDAQLHLLLKNSPTQPDWKLQLLLLGKHANPNLLGVMFDTKDIGTIEDVTLQRQGAAVFVQSIGVADTRNLLFTAVHELGHGLNLAHRFEREVGRADSLSFMNYPELYGGGPGQFWNRFEFKFDPDEIEFLRHGLRSAVIPGGRSFHSIPYWVDGRGGYVPYRPEVKVIDFKLTLSGPSQGDVFDFLQPVFLMVELTNLTGVSFNVPDWWLDPKGGALEVVVKRVADSTRHLQPQTWVPLVHRIYNDTISARTVPDGDSIKRNINLTFGASGFSFAEPGTYEIQTFVSLFVEVGGRKLNYIVPSNILTIRIAYPKTMEEEHDALLMLRSDVGLYFALGGSPELNEAKEALEEVRGRRQKGSKSVTDPIVANIVRCNGLEEGRAYVRPQGNKYVVEKANPERAAKLLGSLGDEALKAFDSDTAQSTKALAQKYKNASSS